MRVAPILNWDLIVRATLYADPMETVSAPGSTQTTMTPVCIDTDLDGCDDC